MSAALYARRWLRNQARVNFPRIKWGMLWQDGTPVPPHKIVSFSMHPTWRTHRDRYEKCHSSDTDPLLYQTPYDFESIGMPILALLGPLPDCELNSRVSTRQERLKLDILLLRDNKLYTMSNKLSRFENGRNFHSNTRKLWTPAFKRWCFGRIRHDDG